VIMDLYSRLIVGWAMDRKPSQELATLALEMSLGRRAKPIGCCCTPTKVCSTERLAIGRC
jgi:transposase InsO family protein